MRWVEALKIWNAEHNPGKWCVAKKGTKEYDEVKAIMAKDKIERGGKAKEKPPTRELETQKTMPSEATLAAQAKARENRARAVKAKEVSSRLVKATAKKRIAKALLKRAMEKRAKKAKEATLAAQAKAKENRARVVEAKKAEAAAAAAKAEAAAATNMPAVKVGNHVELFGYTRKGDVESKYSVVSEVGADYIVADKIRYEWDDDDEGFYNSSEHFSEAKILSDKRWAEIEASEKYFKEAVKREKEAAAAKAPMPEGFTLPYAAVRELVIEAIAGCDTIQNFTEEPHKGEFGYFWEGKAQVNGRSRLDRLERFGKTSLESAFAISTARYIQSNSQKPREGSRLEQYGKYLLESDYQYILRNLKEGKRLQTRPSKPAAAATKETAETMIRDWPNQKGIRTNREEYGKLIRALHEKGYTVTQIQRAIKEQIGGSASLIDDTSRGFWGHAKKEIEAAIAKKK